MKKNTTKNNFEFDSFIKWAHKSGRIFIYCFIAYTVVIPIVICTVYNCFPSFASMAPGLISILTMMVPTSIMEIATYTPILGSSAYLTFATGNLINLKIPCALNAQKIAGVDGNTTEGDAIAIISTCVSSIVTIIVLAAGLILVIPLRGFLTSPTFQVASNYLLPALFGALVLGFISGSGGGTVIKNKLLCTIPAVVLVSVLSILGIAGTGMAGLFVVIAIPLSILTARILCKKGIIRLEKVQQKHQKVTKLDA